MKPLNNKTILNALLDLFFQSLEETNICYCVIGNYFYLPEYTSNDVDLWVDDIKKSEELLLNYAKKLGLRLYMQNKTANGSNNYFYNKSEAGIEVVKIDLMHETAYKSIISIVSGDLIKHNRVKYKTFYVANELIEGVMHLLYPLITFGEVKEKYKSKLVNLSQYDEYRDVITNILGDDLGNQVISSTLKEDWSSIEKKVASIRRHLLLKTLLTFDLNRLNITIKFVSCILRRIITKNGIVISFTGIDGAGKTSIKEYLINNADKYFAKNRKIEFYWRPFLLPRIAKVVGSKGQNEVYNQSGKRVIGSSSTSRLKSIAKYIYYVSDFVLGQIKYFKKSHTGGLVVFDRYHFDNIIYPERFGFVLEKSTMRFFDKFIIPQPDILFYFTADTDILYERKHEIDVGEINQQKALYDDEIKIKRDVITISTDDSFDDSVKEVLLKCFELMSLRYRKDG